MPGCPDGILCILSSGGFYVDESPGREDRDKKLHWRFSTAFRIGYIRPISGIVDKQFLTRFMVQVHGNFRGLTEDLEMVAEL